MNITKIQKYLKLQLMVAFGISLAAVLPVQAETVTKVDDLFLSAYGGGASFPSGAFTLVGSNLFFTSQKGGVLGQGTVTYYDPYASNTVDAITFDNGNLGKTPWASVSQAFGLLWVTTSAGGAGNKGTIVGFDPVTYSVDYLWYFPTNTYPGTSYALYGSGSRSTPLPIGNDLWVTTLTGGAYNKGTVVKYTPSNGVATVMLNLDGTNYGGQGFGSIVKGGSNAYYFTTFTGGTNSGSGFPNGAGTLQKFSFDTNGNPIFTKLIDLPTNYNAFPGGDPLPVGNDTLYFTTVGNAANPGAIIKYTISTSNWTTLFTFSTNGLASTNYGKQPQYEGSLVNYQNALYFSTFSGGTSNKGIIGKLTLSNNVVTKLADLEGTGGLALGGSPYNSGLLYTNPVDGRISIYLPTSAGGTQGTGSGNGTILKISLAPQPIVASIQNSSPGNVTLNWTGGYSPFSVDEKDFSITNPYSIGVYTNLLTNSLVLQATNSASYFRINGQTN